MTTKVSDRLQHLAITAKAGRTLFQTAYERLASTMSTSHRRNRARTLSGAQPGIDQADDVVRFAELSSAIPHSDGHLLSPFGFMHGASSPVVSLKAISSGTKRVHRKRAEDDDIYHNCDRPTRLAR